MLKGNVCGSFLLVVSILPIIQLFVYFYLRIHIQSYDIIKWTNSFPGISNLGSNISAGRLIYNQTPLEKMASECSAVVLNDSFLHRVDGKLFDFNSVVMYPFFYSKESQKTEFSF